MTKLSKNRVWSVRYCKTSAKYLTCIVTTKMLGLGPKLNKNTKLLWKCLRTDSGNQRHHAAYSGSSKNARSVPHKISSKNWLTPVRSTYHVKTSYKCWEHFLWGIIIAKYVNLQLQIWVERSHLWFRRFFSKKALKADILRFVTACSVQIRTRKNLAFRHCSRSVCVIKTCGFDPALGKYTSFWFLYVCPTKKNNYIYGALKASYVP